MSQTSRDPLAPLTDPRPGDVVGKTSITRTVLMRDGDFVDYRTSKGRVICNYCIDSWKAWCRSAEVLHVAD